MRAQAQSNATYLHAPRGCCVQDTSEDCSCEDVSNATVHKKQEIRGEFQPRGGVLGVDLMHVTCTRPGQEATVDI